MNTQAAVLVNTGKPLVMADLEIPALRAGQVLVKISYSGICHTQILECRGYRGHDPYLPHCLGHEGSGIVQEVGAGVRKVKPGVKVVLSWIKGTGADVPGCVYRLNGKAVNAGAITTLGRHAVISENRITVIPEDVSLREAALFGCAIPTGFGSVMNAARPESGQSLVVFGAGGVGCCAIAAAIAMGCEPLIAIDLCANKLERACQLGATHTINANDIDPVNEVRAICRDGVDFAIEATGRPDAMRQSLECVRPRGGTAVIIGNARHGERLVLDPKQLNLGKRLLGTWGGDSQPDRDYRRYGKLITSGRVNLTLLASNDYPLDQVNQAIHDLESGVSIRPIVNLWEDEAHPEPKSLGNATAWREPRPPNLIPA